MCGNADEVEKIGGGGEVEQKVFLVKKEDRGGRRTKDDRVFSGRKDKIGRRETEDVYTYKWKQKYRVRV